VLVARRGQRLEALAAELGRAHVVAADLTAPDTVSRLAGEVAGRGLEVRTLINNAGFGRVGRFERLSADSQLGMIDLNVRVPVALTRLFLPAMLARSQGAILNVASTAAFQPGPGFAVYFASKAFVLSFSEALHQELKGRGVRISVLCPGPTRTEFGEVAGARRRIPSFLSADAAAVARAGLDGLDRNRALVIPGLVNKLTANSGRFLPRAAMRRIVARLKI
jgi:uncharacterized protein